VTVVPSFLPRGLPLVVDVMVIDKGSSGSGVEEIVRGGEKEDRSIRERAACRLNINRKLLFITYFFCTSLLTITDSACGSGLCLVFEPW
jgi:hypothetical protein